MNITKKNCFPDLKQINIEIDSLLSLKDNIYKEQLTSGEYSTKIQDYIAKNYLELLFFIVLRKDKELTFPLSTNDFINNKNFENVYGKDFINRLCDFININHIILTDYIENDNKFEIYNEINSFFDYNSCNKKFSFRINTHAFAIYYDFILSYFISNYSTIIYKFELIEGSL